MQTTDILLFGAFAVLLAVLSPWIGRWIANVMDGSPGRLPGFLRRLERLIYRGSGINPSETMDWQHYTGALLAFNLTGFIAVMVLQLLQNRLPFNPQGLPAVSWPLAFNTAVSFATNTNWQAYSGESTLSYLTQMLGLTVQNFVSAATGIAVAFALARGLASRSARELGNFWCDMTRATVYILLPLSAVLALILAGQGVVQTFHSYVEAHTLEGAVQMIPLGPAASQIAIKQLGTNGGGFFGVNSAHPFENPTVFSNLLQLWAILLIPAALPFAFGRTVRNPRHGACLFAAMLTMFLAGLALTYTAELQLAGRSAAGIWEGKEVRHGLASSVLWASATTAASNGSVNTMHSSLSPLAGMAALFNIMLGEVIFGGVGAGLYGIIAFVILTVFLAGLMVGRTPEYLGKRLDRGDILLASVAVLAPCVVILLGCGITMIWTGTLDSRANTGPHGFTEILYAWSSAAGNNGSAFAGLNANTGFFNIGLGIAMLIGRYAVIVPMLALAGRFAVRKITPPSSGSFPTDGATFAVLLIAVILIVGGLTFLPALFLGPAADHLLWISGRTL
ncbi:MAG TPA: potassium-transporting ATPase subunit KdpA [Pontiellaceae bacterium]|nr:potassium-transporting ATPase subunit KdpA [Pontiellaceae bacterium]HPR83344.1 potassium-transporting ATPase subunit KdpA [Pontiellaceae bacterium]